MTIDELKEKVEAYRKSCEEKGGGMVMFSKTGPASMGMIDALVAVVERQQREIDELRRDFDSGLPAVAG